MKERNQIEEKYKWDLIKFFKNDDEFSDSIKKFDKNKDLVVKFEGKLNDDKILLECLKFEDKVGLELNKLGTYIYCRLSEDVRDSKVNELCQLFEKIASDYSIASSFVDVEISEFSDKKLLDLMKNPIFSDYKRDFEGVLRTKKHVLSKKEEKLLSGMSFLGGFSENFDKFDNGDIKFNDVKDSEGKLHELDHAKYLELEESKDKELRKNTFVEYNGAFGRYINILSSNYINDVKADCYFAKVRGYKSALSASIYNEEASDKVYEMLIKKVRENIDVFYDYMEIKRQMLGLNKIAISDCFAPIVKDFDKRFTYDEGIELIKKAVAPLGEDYVNLIQRAKDERWIDVYPNKGKEGSYSTSVYGITPLVLVNFTGNLNSVFTLAHELGHALHSYFSSQKQKIQTHDYVIFVAEVASTTNEMLLLKYLLNQAKNDNEKMYYFDTLFNEVKGTIFRQTMFSEFEEIAHSIYEQGEALSKDRLCEEYFKLNKFYFGNKVELFDEVKYEWARIPHFYRSFYVYKYATGLISALNFSDKIFREDKEAIEKYMGFLSAGSSASPIKILQDAGCDLEKDETFDNVFAYLRQILITWKEMIK